MPIKKTHLFNAFYPQRPDLCPFTNLKEVVYRTVREKKCNGTTLCIFWDEIKESPHLRFSHCNDETIFANISQHPEILMVTPTVSTR